MQSVATREEASYSSYKFSAESKSSYQQSAAGRLVQNQQVAQRHSGLFSKVKSSGYADEANNRRSVNSDFLERASQRLNVNNGFQAETASSEEYSDRGDFFATYGTKKERRTVRKDALAERASEQSSEVSEQRLRRDQNSAREAAERRRLEDAAERRRLEEAAATLRAVSERAARQQRAQQHQQQQQQQPPPLPPKQQPLDLRRMLASFRQAEAMRSESQASRASEGTASEEAKPVEYRTQGTTTDQVNENQTPPVPRANASVRAESLAKPERVNQSTETDSIQRGLLNFVVASSDNPDVDEEVLRPNSHPDVSAPAPYPEVPAKTCVDKLVVTEPRQDPKGRDFTQQVISESDSVLEELISPEKTPAVSKANKRSKKPRTIPSKSVDAPALLDDPRAMQPVSAEPRRPVDELVGKSRCPVVELEPDFRWMFGHKGEQVDESSNPTPEAPESHRKLSKPPKFVDAFTNVQSDLGVPEPSPRRLQSSLETTDKAQLSNAASLDQAAKSTKQTEAETTTQRSLDSTEKQGYLREIMHLRSVISELENRLTMQEIKQVQEEKPSTTLKTIRRRTVGLMVKPPCRDVAINFVFEDAKPAQRSVGVNVSVEDSEVASKAVESRGVQQSDGEGATSNATIINQSQTRQTFIQRLHQTYGISKLELVNIITELLKRDVKSIGLQVCLEPEEDILESLQIIEVQAANRLGATSDFGTAQISSSSSRMSGSSADVFQFREGGNSGSGLGESSLTITTESSEPQFLEKSAHHEYHQYASKDGGIAAQNSSSSGSLDAFSGGVFRFGEAVSGSGLDESSLAGLTEPSEPQFVEKGAHQEYQYVSEDGGITARHAVTTRHFSSRQVFSVPIVAANSSSSVYSHSSMSQQHHSVGSLGVELIGQESTSRVQDARENLGPEADPATEPMRTEISFEMADDDFVSVPDSKAIQSATTESVRTSQLTSSQHTVSSSSSSTGSGTLTAATAWGSS